MTAVTEARGDAGNAELGGGLATTAILAGDPETSRRIAGRSIPRGRGSQARGGIGPLPGGVDGR